jgi:hypothetical protein
MSEQPFNWSGRRENDPAHQRVAEFLLMDIQQSPEWGRELATQIDAVISGKLANWERIGNAFRLELSNQSAEIEDMVDPSHPKQVIPIEEFRTAVLAWCEKIS